MLTNCHVCFRAQHHNTSNMYLTLHCVVWIYMSSILQHVVHHGPLDHEMINNPNTKCFSANWQSVAHAQMQATAEEMASSQDIGRVQISPMVYARARANETPRFFAWNGGVVEEDEVLKKQLTFKDNSHSEYRDLYDLKTPVQRVSFT